MRPLHRMCHLTRIIYGTHRPRNSWVQLSLPSMVISLPTIISVILYSAFYPGPKEAAIGQITEFQKLFLFPGFLVYMSVLIIASLVIIFYYAPK